MAPAPAPAGARGRPAPASASAPAGGRKKAKGEPAGGGEELSLDDLEAKEAEGEDTIVQVRTQWNQHGNE